MALIRQALRPSFVAIFKAIAQKRGPHWKLDGEEQEALVMGWGPILQHMLAKLGNQEQVLFTMALMSTTAIVGGKAIQDITIQASKTASIRTAESAGSSAFSASGEVVRAPEAGNSYE